MHILQKKSFKTSLKRRKVFKDFKRKYPLLFKNYRCFNVNENNKLPRVYRKTKADKNDPSESALTRAMAKQTKSTSKPSTNSEIQNEAEKEVASTASRTRTRSKKGVEISTIIDNVETPQEISSSVKRTRAKSKTPIEGENEVASIAVKRTRGRTKTPVEGENEINSTTVRHTQGRTKTPVKSENEVVLTTIKRTRGRTKTPVEGENEVSTTSVKRTKIRNKKEEPSTIIDKVEIPQEIPTPITEELAEENVFRKGLRTRSRKAPESGTENFLELQPKTRKKAITTARGTKSKKQNNLLPEISENVVVEQTIQPYIKYTDENQYAVQNVEENQQLCELGQQQYMDENQYVIPNIKENPHLREIEQQPTNLSDENYYEIQYIDEPARELEEPSHYESCYDEEEFINEENLGENIFDKTMYNPGNIDYEEYIPDDRDWNADFDPDFQIQKQLQMQPMKSCLKRNSPKQLTHDIRSYKFLDENNELKVIIDGFSHSTFIKRIIVYLRAIKNAFEMEMVQLIIPGINFEARLLGNLQMISDIFRDELIPMLVYSIYNKDSNDYHRILMEQFRETISYFLYTTILKEDHYYFENPKEMFYYTNNPMYNTGFVNILPRDKNSIFAENFYSFNALLLYGVFNKHIHFKVVQKMFDSFKNALHGVAMKSMTTE